MRFSYHSECSANRLTATWQKVWHGVRRKKARERAGHGQRNGGIVGGCSDALSAVYCYCALVTAGSQGCQDGAGVSQETPASPLEWPGGNSAPGGRGIDRRTFKVRAFERGWWLTSMTSWTLERTRIKGEPALNQTTYCLLRKPDTSLMLRSHQTQFVPQIHVGWLSFDTRQICCSKLISKVCS